MRSQPQHSIANDVEASNKGDFSIRLRVLLAMANFKLTPVYYRFFFSLILQTFLPKSFFLNVEDNTRLNVTSFVTWLHIIANIVLRGWIYYVSLFQPSHLPMPVSHLISHLTTVACRVSNCFLMHRNFEIKDYYVYACPTSVCIIILKYIYLKQNTLSSTSQELRDRSQDIFGNWLVSKVKWVYYRLKRGILWQQNSASCTEPKYTEIWFEKSWIRPISDQYFNLTHFGP